MGMFDKLFGGRKEEPVRVENDAEMLEYIAQQECPCGGHFVICDRTDAIRNVNIPGWLAAVEVKTECGSCKKRRNIRFVFTVVRMA